MCKAAHPLGGKGSSNPRCWRGERLPHHGDGVSKVICAFCVVFDSWLVSRMRRTNIMGHPGLHHTYWVFTLKLWMYWHASFCSELATLMAKAMFSSKAIELCWFQFSSEKCWTCSAAFLITTRGQRQHGRGQQDNDKLLLPQAEENIAEGEGNLLDIITTSGGGGGQLARFWHDSRGGSRLTWHHQWCVASVLTALFPGVGIGHTWNFQKNTFP